MAELYIIIGGPLQVFALLSQIWRCVIRKSSADLSALAYGQGVVLNIFGIFYGIKVCDQWFVFFAAVVAFLYFVILLLKLIYLK